MTTNEDLAKAEGINTLLLQVGYLTLISITVAILVRMLGVLLITSMFIIPATTAGQFVEGSVVMWGGHAMVRAIVMAMLVYCRGFIGGMALSIMANTPTDPKHGALPHRLIHVCFAGEAPSLRHW